VEEFIFEEILAEYESLLSVFPVGLHVIHGQYLLMVLQTPLCNSTILLTYNTGTRPLRATLVSYYGIPCCDTISEKL
jgi:hypothetical protein